MWIPNPREEYWAGTEESAIAAQILADKINATDPKAAYGEMELSAPTLLQREGRVGVIRIEGPLLTSAPDWAKALFGVVDYNDISAALVEAARDQSIGAILLDIDSPGGAVNGIDTPSALIKQIDDEVKPVHAYTSGMMASAAYWLGVGARELNSGPLAMLGSIGVLQKHSERSKADAMSGITTTVLRAGKFKALGNPHEPLSEDARAEIQASLDYTYQVFMSHVAESRGVTYAAGDAKMGQGRVFLGEQAVTAGLADKVMSYEEALAFAEETAVAAVDSRKSLIQNPKNKKEGSTLMRKQVKLSAAEIAAIASGASLSALVTDEAAAPAAAEAAAAALAAATEAPAAEAPAAEAPASASAEAVAAEPKSDGVVALLQGQLRDAQEAAIAARVDLARVSAEATSMRATHDSLVSIARSAVQKMHIALGGTGAHVEALAGDALVAEHGAVSATFMSKFPVGGVAAASAQAEQPGKSKADPMQQARIQAVRLAK